MFSYVFGADAQWWKPRNMFVSLSCSRWSVGNSDSFMFAATECGGEKGHFQHGGFLHIFNYVYVVSCWNENPPPWIFITMWAELRQSCALSLRAQPWETVIKTSPRWAVRLMKGVFMPWPERKACGFPDLECHQQWGVGDAGCLAGNTRGSQEAFSLGWGCSSFSPVQAGTETAPL